MRDFQGRQTLKQVLYSRWTALFLVLIVLITAHSVYRIWQRSQVVAADKNELAVEVAELQARKAQLEKNISALETDQGVETAIREKFAVVKEGEGVITIITPPEATPTPTSTEPWWHPLWPANWFK